MGSFYLPKNTLGVFSQSQSTLLVYAGRCSSIGFQGTGAEIAAVEFSFSNSPIREVYDAGVGRRELLLPTDKPSSFTVSAANSGGKGLAKDLHVRVAAEPYSKDVGPQGQIDVTACWIASLSWITLALNYRATKSQNELLLLAGKNSSTLWGRDGSIQIQALTNFINVRLRDLKFKCEMIPAKDLWEYVDLYPLIIGYKETLMGHVNVITKSRGDGQVEIMDPWFPDPSARGFTVEASDDGTMYLYKAGESQNDPPFKFSGTKTTRKIGYYTDRPLNGGKLFVAYPTSIE